MSNNMIYTRAVHGFTVVALAAALVACGGGGSDGGDSSPLPTTPGTTTPGTTPGTTTPPVVTEDLQAYKASSYPASDPRQYMFDQINTARTQCGFGALHHNTKLDTAAQGHADWLARNNYSGHFQAVGTPGFTGVAPWDRVTAAGYPYIETSEGLGAAIGAERVDYHKEHVPGQLATVYHAIGILRPLREIGFGHAVRSAFGLSPGFLTGHNIATATDRQKMSDVATYPCQGVVASFTFHPDETPNPLSPRDLDANPPGHPIVVVSPYGTKLTDLAFVVTDVAAGSNVALAATRTSDNDAKISVSYAGFAIPDQELKKNSSYRVQVTGKVDGKDFSKDFTFSTNGNDKAGEKYGKLKF